ncbi:MAG: HlyD family efflux transporter periplasmic adaptor subunit, partial [Bacteroidota bacterium]
GGEAIGRLYLAEEDITLVKVGQTVEIALNTHKDRTFEGLVSKIHPAFDEQQQSFVVEARFVEQPDRIFPGTQLQANIVVGHTEKALVIPTRYLLPGDSVQLDDQSKVAVKTGLHTEAWVEITSGLQTGNNLILKK